MKDSSVENCEQPMHEPVPSGLEELNCTEEPTDCSGASLNAELIAKGDATCECWLEVVEGMRVRTAVPADRLRGLGLDEGDEFLWSPNECTVAAKSRHEDGAKRERLRAEIGELRREFHEELKDIDIGLNEE